MVRLVKPPLPPRADGSTAPPRRLVTVKEACAYGRFCHTRFYDHLNAGRITAFKDPTRPTGRTLVDLDSIDNMLASFVQYQPAHKAR